MNTNQFQIDMNNNTLFERTLDVLEKTGLNWSVTKEPLVTADGKTTETFGMFRSDSQSWLGSVGNQYTPFQNHQLAETIVQASEGIGKVTTSGGQLDGGRKVFLQVALPDDYIGNSGIKRHITALNSHDGSSSISFGSSNVVVICQNTFYKAHKDLSKFRHTASAEDRLKQAMQDLRRSIQLDEALMVDFKRMAGAKLDGSMVESIIDKLFGVKKDTKIAEVSAVKRNQVEAFSNALSKEMNDHGATIWSLFNAVTRYTNHYASPKGDEAKQSYIMAGGGYKTNLMGYDECMKWLASQSKTKVYDFVGA
jgi:phage/plasmid-like protein (TIGR03299 family)